MKVDIWSDFVCPYCYIGKKRFKQALDELKTSEEIQINFRSYQLNPNLKNKNIKTDMVQDLADMYQIPREKALESIERAVALAQSEGLVYDYKNMIPANTLDAHRLNYFAQEYNKDWEMSTRIFQAYFAEGLDISNFDILSKLAEEVGLDKKSALDMLGTNKYMDQIEKDYQDAIQLNIEMVPSFIFNDEYKIVGKLSKDDILGAIRKQI